MFSYVRCVIRYTRHAKQSKPDDTKHIIQIEYSDQQKTVNTNANLKSRFVNNNIGTTTSYPGQNTLLRPSISFENITYFKTTNHTTHTIFITSLI